MKNPVLIPRQTLAIYGFMGAPLALVGYPIAIWLPAFYASHVGVSCPFAPTRPEWRRVEGGRGGGGWGACGVCGGGVWGGVIDRVAELADPNLNSGCAHHLPNHCVRMIRKQQSAKWS